MADEIPKRGAEGVDPETLAEIEQAERLDWKARFKTIGKLGWSLRDKPAPVPALLWDGAEHPDGSERSRVFLPKGRVGILAAAGGTGKTHALVSLALSIATGKPWFGQEGFGVAHTGPVVLALGEEDDSEIQRRLHFAAEALDLGVDEYARAEAMIYPLSLNGLQVGMVNGKGQREPFYAELVQALADNKPPDGWRAILLDPGSRFMGPEAEKDNAMATRFIEALERLTKVEGHPAVLVAHHVAKSAVKPDGSLDTQAARGSSALTDGARWVATMGIPQVASDDNGPKEWSQDWVVLTHSKSNYGPAAKRRYLRRNEHGVLVAQLEKPDELADKAKGKAKRGSLENEGLDF